MGAAEAVGGSFGSEKNAVAEVETGPVPGWVDVAPWSMPEGMAPPGVAAEILLLDAQDRLTPTGSDYYYRLVVRLVKAEGVRQNAEQTVDYFPEYQRVTWHALRISRGAETLDRLANTTFKKLQRELEFEAKIYSGRITAATVLEDVRVGDVLEVSYTIHDANPLMVHHLTARHFLGAGYPIRRQRIIVQTPADGPRVSAAFVVPEGTRDLPSVLYRQAALQTALETEVAGGQKIYRWEGTSIPAVTFDDMIAPKASPYYPMLQISSLKTWADVVEWAEPLFASSAGLPETARALVEKWKRDYRDPGDRLAAAVHWAQDDLRYFAMAMGEHNVRPRPLAEICTSRFGDCKDKSVLLAALLRELGFEAWPALVSTYALDQLFERAPHPFAFNHAIVAYRFRDQLCWVDPTLKAQRRSGETWAIPPYGGALILRPGESALTRVLVPPRLEPDTTTREVITIDARSGDALVAAEITVRDLQADFYRQRLEATTSAELSKQWLNFIGRFYKQIEEVDPPEAKEDEASNSIVIRARYRIPGFLRSDANEATFSIYAYGIRSLLDAPNARRRHWPYALAGGRFLRHRIELELPFAMAPEQQPQVIVADGIEYRGEKGLMGNRVVTEHDFRTTADFVSADRMGPFCDAVDEILAALGTGVRQPLNAAGPKPVNGDLGQKPSVPAP